MFRIVWRGRTARRKSVIGIRYCDGCARVSTPGHRVQRHYDHVQTRAYTWMQPS